VNKTELKKSMRDVRLHISCAIDCVQNYDKDDSDEIWTLANAEWWLFQAAKELELAQAELKIFKAKKVGA
jgi:hypothetical protein